MKIRLSSQENSDAPELFYRAQEAAFVAQKELGHEVEKYAFAQKYFFQEIGGIFKRGYQDIVSDSNRRADFKNAVTFTENLIQKSAGDADFFDQQKIQEEMDVWKKDQETLLNKGLAHVPPRRVFYFLNLLYQEKKQENNTKSGFLAPPFFSLGGNNVCHSPEECDVESRKLNTSLVFKNLEHPKKGSSSIYWKLATYDFIPGTPDIALRADNNLFLIPDASQLTFSDQETLVVDVQQPTTLIPAAKFIGHGTVGALHRYVASDETQKAQVYLDRTQENFILKAPVGQKVELRLFEYDEFILTGEVGRALRVDDQLERKEPSSSSWNKKDLPQPVIDVFEKYEKYRNRKLFKSFSLPDKFFLEEIKIEFQKLFKGYASYVHYPENRETLGKELYKKMFEQAPFFADCELSNNLFFIAARLYGYDVQLAYGKLGTYKAESFPVENSYLKQVNHLWVEVNQAEFGYLPVDATPLSEAANHDKRGTELSELIEKIEESKNLEEINTLLSQLDLAENDENKFRELLSQLKKEEIRTIYDFELDYHLNTYTYEISQVTSDSPRCPHGMKINERIKKEDLLPAYQNTRYYKNTIYKIQHSSTDSMGEKIYEFTTSDRLFLADNSTWWLLEAPHLLVHSEENYSVVPGVPHLENFNLFEKEFAKIQKTMSLHCENDDAKFPEFSISSPSHFLKNEVAYGNYSEEQKPGVDLNQYRKINFGSNNSLTARELFSLAEGTYRKVNDVVLQLVDDKKQILIQSGNSFVSINDGEETYETQWIPLGNNQYKLLFVKRTVHEKVINLTNDYLKTFVVLDKKNKKDFETRKSNFKGLFELMKKVSRTDYPEINTDPQALMDYLYVFEEGLKLGLGEESFPNLSSFQKKATCLEEWDPPLYREKECVVEMTSAVSFSEMYFEFLKARQYQVPMLADLGWLRSEEKKLLDEVLKKYFRK